jgi:hypothetical protein
MTTKDWIEIIYSFVLTISTVIYARITSKLFQETKSQRLALTEPLLSMRLQSNTENLNIIELHIENLGNGIAYNIRFIFLTDFIYTNQKEKKLSDIAFFKSGLIALAPRQHHKIFLTSLINDTINGVEHRPFEIKVVYDTLSQKNKESIFGLNLTEFEGLLYMDKKNEIQELIKSIRELTSAIEKRENKNNC